jgi:L-2-hydroxyglutarate oxidase LhgO
MESIDTLVIGAGVTGLAAAAALADAGYTVVVIDRHHRPGQETSTHNSGVIHAGLYYPAESLKAQLCIEGAERLYQFCAARSVRADRCGKLVVAIDDREVPELERLKARGIVNGVEGLEIVDRRFVRAREPHVEASAALWSPNTGRVDASALVRALLREAERHGAIFLPDSGVTGGDPIAGAFQVRLERETLRARTVVNAAGLYADQVSGALAGEAFTIYPCRGEYAELKPSRRHWVNGLVYPLPHASGHGLGVHMTKTTDGNVLIGPTIRYQARKDDYENDRVELREFAASARPMLPELTVDDLTYGGSGIRAKLHPPEESFADFLVRHDARCPRVIHAAGIDSPGLTACLAIANRIRRLVGEILD